MNGNALFGSCVLIVGNANIGDVSFNSFNGKGIGASSTCNFISGFLNGCTIVFTDSISFEDTAYQSLSIFQNEFSNFSKSFDITGLTTLDITAALNYVGIVNLTSTNPTESIDTIINFPNNQPFRIYPAPGLTVTFVHGGGPSQPHCAGSANVVVNGTKLNYIEFTYLNGRICQTGGFIG